MRLLNTSTLEVVEFVGDRSTPAYAILSHTWGDDEVTFDDLKNNRSAAVRKKGYQKILEACKQARLPIPKQAQLPAHSVKRHPYDTENGLEWIWIDTCCIDKSSSVELSEAINSMFKWYRDAAICFAYLSDVHDGDDADQFSQSRWFTRGWTLQELLAPRRILFFFTSSWKIIGTKTSLAKHIIDATGIGKAYLFGHESASVAHKMSWTSKRETTRVEDFVYCLLGVFDVNMPLQYGEGRYGAFRRLQEEIMKSTNDQSIFAWGWANSLAPKYSGVYGRKTRYLAPWADAFASAGEIVRCQVGAPEIDLIPTYRGITLEAPLCRALHTSETGLEPVYYIPIKCRPRDDVLSLLAIPVARRSATSQEYTRLAQPPILVPVDIWKKETVALRYLKQPVPPLYKDLAMSGTFALRRLPAGFKIAEAWPADKWQFPLPATENHLGGWTKAVWDTNQLETFVRTWDANQLATPVRKNIGYVHLQWSGDDEDTCDTSRPIWPDLLLRLTIQDAGPLTKVPTFGLATYPEGKWLPGISEEAGLRFVHKLGTACGHITATIETRATTSSRYDDSFVIDLVSSSCQPWSLDDCLREECGLELVLPTTTSKKEALNLAIHRWGRD